MNKRIHESDGQDDDPNKRQKIDTTTISIIALPVDIQMCILRFLVVRLETVVVRELLFACKAWFNFINIDESCAKARWEWHLLSRHNFGHEHLYSEENANWCGYESFGPICVFEDGTFNAQGRLKLQEEPHNYSDLLKLSRLLVKWTCQIGRNSKWISVIQGAHTPDALKPLILKHDTQHLVVPWEMEGMPPPFGEDENVGGVVFRTIKKLFRFPDREVEYLKEQNGMVNPDTQGHYDIFWEKILKQEAEEHKIDAITKIKSEMESILKEVSVVRMANFSGEEVSLYFWMGRFGSYLGGYWWMKERDS